MTGMFIAMVYAVRWAGPRISKPVLLLTSLATAGIGMAWLSRIDATTPVASILPPLLVLGIGQGIAIILLTDFGMAEVDPGDAGAASGLVNTAHQIGGSVGLALLTVVYGSAVHHDAAPGAVAQAHGYATVFEVATGFYALAVIVAVVMLTAHRRASRSTAPVTVAAAS